MIAPVFSIFTPLRRFAACLSHSTTVDTAAESPRRRFSLIISLLALLLALPLVAQTRTLSLRVLDPQGAVVPGARVAVYAAGGHTPLAIAITGSAGTATASVAGGDAYTVEVLAAGFGVQRQRVSAEAARSPIDVSLQVVSQPSTVVVTAARTPLPQDESGADSDALDSPQLTNLQPVDAVDAIRFLPGAVVSMNGRRGGLASLFVRGGESRYNKVIVDGVAVNDPGGTYDFSALPMDQVDRVEFLRGAQSTLYGSDAMTSVVQAWSRTGSTRTPELRFGADGGNFSTARGYASLAGARGRLDYNLFGQQFNTDGQGINDAFSQSSEGANIGVRLARGIALRWRARHDTDRAGIQSFWKFNGRPLLPPDQDERSRQNNFLSSLDLSISRGRLLHRFSGFEYHHRRLDQDTLQEAGRASPVFGNFDFPFSAVANYNRAGFEYVGEYWARDWARTTFGYHFEDENGFFGDLTAPPLSHGLRRNHALYGEEVLTWSRLSLVGGARFVHNESFGNRVVPRIAATVLALRGGHTLSGTRLRFAYATGIKEPRFEESFGIGGFGVVPNPNLRPEENRSFETGFEQGLFANRASLSATYFNNLFRDRIDFSFDPVTFAGQYVNVNRSMAHGFESELHVRATDHITLLGSYTYDSSQILAAPFASDPLLQPGRPLLRRPKHSGSLLLSYFGRRWGGDVAGTFVGRRPDSDFSGLLPPITYAAGYGRVDVGLWHALTSRLTAYANIENLLDRHYDEVAGYPALGTNFRAGMRFRVGGE